MNRVSSCSLLLVACILIASQIDVTSSTYGSAAGYWKISFPNEATNSILMATKSLRNITLKIYDIDLTKDGADFSFHVKSDDPKLIAVHRTIDKGDISRPTVPTELAQWSDEVQLNGLSLGYTTIYVELHTSTGAVEHSLETLNVTLLREQRVNDKIFNYSAAALVLLMFLNLGTVLDLQRLKRILFKPIGPFIGFCARYIIMPALGLGLGYALLPSSKELQLGLFFSALAPSGGLANICAVFLKGNINLSIATTTMNSLLALAMLPLWIYVLGSVVFDESELKVPFLNLALSSVALIAAITLGIFLRKFIPKTTKFIFNFLKPLSVLLSLCLIGLTVGINLFVFQQLTAMILLATLLLPIIGYILAFVLCKLLCQSPTDSLTIAIETSVLNMTVPIMLLQFSLNQPRADMAIVVPITAALTSLCLVLIFYIVRRVFGCNKKLDSEAFDKKELIQESL